MARSFRQDLKAARMAWIAEAKTDDERQRREESDFLSYADKDGRVADFHATRHTFISQIVAGGASVKTAQELARHSTPVLTIGRYSHARLHDLQSALESLPDLNPSAPTPQAQRATGTDGKAIMAAGTWEQIWEQLGGKSRQNVANGGERREDCTRQEDDTADDSQPATVSLLGNKKAATGESRREAEGTGLEPATGKPAPDFESGC